MKCDIGTDELYPVLSIDNIGSGDHKVPPRLLRELQDAELHYELAQKRIVLHLIKTGQEYNHNVARALHIDVPED